MDKPPVDILANIKELFAFIVGGFLTIIPTVIVGIGLIFLAILGILFFFFSGTPAIQIN